MAYGTANVDVIQSSTANVPVQFNDGNGTQVGTLCRAWVNFDGTTSPGTIRASFNVGSVTKNATGDYTVNFTNALPDANYSWSFADQYNNTGAVAYQNIAPLVQDGANQVLSTSLRFITAIYTSNSKYDCAIISLQVFR